MKKRVTLNKARAQGRLEDFIAQEELRGVSGSTNVFDRAIATAIKAPKAKRQTSRSPSRGSSGGK